MNKKKKIKFFVILICTLIIILGAYYYISPYRGTVNKFTNSLPIDEKVNRDDAVQDINYMIKQIKDKHFSAVNGVPEKVQAQYETELNNLSYEPTTMEIWRACSRILNKLSDGHSTINYIGGDIAQLDVEFQKEETGLYCKLKDGTIKKVNKINNISTDDLYKTFLEQFSFDNSYYARANFESYLRKPITLSLLGINANKEVKLEFENESENLVLQFKEPEQKEAIKPVSFEINEDKSLGIFTLNVCTLSEEYKNSLKEFFTEVKNKNIKNVAIDLRSNGGGNSEVIGEFIKYLDVDSYNDYVTKTRYMFKIIGNNSAVTKNNKYKDLTYSGKLYTLTSTRTFSSAMMFTVVLADNNLAEVIGEPAGNKPTSYGDILQFQLPNSKLMFTTTFKLFSRPDSLKDSEEAQIPDYKVESKDAINKLYELIN